MASNAPSVTLIAALVLTSIFVCSVGLSRASEDGTVIGGEAAQSDTNPKGILVEVFLSPEHRDDIPAIKRDLETLAITRVRTQVFRLGHPPKNLAIGRDVPAAVAQLAIRLAVDHNDGVEFLLPEYRFFPDHVAIGTSAFDEASQIAISQENLQQLRDPTLTTQAFHELYRRLTGEDQRRPTYLK